MNQELHKQFTDYLVTVNTTMWDNTLKLYDAHIKMATQLAQNFNVTKAFEHLHSK